MWLYPVSGSIKREILYRMDGIVKKKLTLQAAGGMVLY